MKMKEKLYRLFHQRQEVKKWESEVDDAQKVLETTLEYKNLQYLKEAVHGAKTKIEEAEEFIKETTVKDFIHFGLKNTKPYDGIQIKKFDVVHLLDERQAITWAATNAPQVLSLKQTPFNKIAKVLDLDFVQKTTEYRAQIASDLGMYEEGE